MGSQELFFYAGFVKFLRLLFIEKETIIKAARPT